MSTIDPVLLAVLVVIGVVNVVCGYWCALHGAGPAGTPTVEEIELVELVAAPPVDSHTEPLLVSEPP
jgi:hypothetical protein